jgi:hypothetical protein
MLESKSLKVIKSHDIMKPKIKTMISMKHIVMYNGSDEKNSTICKSPGKEPPFKDRKELAK